MKLNNKGFAITSVLYGLLILFVSLVGTYLAVLVSKMNRLNNISEDINEKYDFSDTVFKNDDGLQIITSYQAPYTGKYKFLVNFDGDSLYCTSYIRKGTVITSDFKDGTFVESACNDSKQNISSIFLLQIWSNGDDTDE